MKFLTSFFIYDVFPLIVKNTALYIASEKGNAEIVQLLLSREDIDINALSVFVIFYNTI